MIMIWITLLKILQTAATKFFDFWKKNREKKFHSKNAKKFVQIFVFRMNLVHIVKMLLISYLCAHISHYSFGNTIYHSTPSPSTGWVIQNSVMNTLIGQRYVSELWLIFDVYLPIDAIEMTLLCVTKISSWKNMLNKLHTLSKFVSILYGFDNQ